MERRWSSFSGAQVTDITYTLTIKIIFEKMVCFVLVLCGSFVLIYNCDTCSLLANCLFSINYSKYLHVIRSALILRIKRLLYKNSLLCYTLSFGFEYYNVNVILQLLSFRELDTITILLPFSVPVDSFSFVCRMSFL